MRFLVFLVFAVCGIGWSNAQKPFVPADYIWTSPSRNSSESMPCGGGDIGLNIWTENGDIMLYLAKSGTFDEANTLLKMGRIRLHFNNYKLDESEGFRQILKTYDGYVLITSGSLKVKIWVDALNSHAVSVEASDKKSIDATLTYENWRYRDLEIRKGEGHQGSYKWVMNKQTHTFADSIGLKGKNRLEVYHRNRQQTVFDTSVSLQKLDGSKSNLANPVGGNVSSAIILLDGMNFTGETADGTYQGTPFRGWKARSIAGKKSVAARIWLSAGSEKNDVPAKTDHRKAFDNTVKWWHAFWQRSYIDIQGEGANLSRNYTLFRYMLGCNSDSKWPTKFNGGLFTFDPALVTDKYPFSPDFRLWGGGTFTAQNQRLVYWPMLKNGDFDLLKPQLDTYLYMYQNAKERCKAYWNHPGACFAEQIENYGLPNPAEYGFKHPQSLDAGVEFNAWLEYEWDTVLEFVSMALEANRYSDIDISKYEDWMVDAVRFFDEHYRYLALSRGRKELNADGKIIIFPGSGCETYKMAYNPSSTVAGLRVVSSQLAEYFGRKYGDANNPMEGLTADERTKALKKLPARLEGADLVRYFKGLLSRLPDIPYREIDGKKTIAPAVVWERVQNVETPQLYPVFPWRVYGIGCSDDSLSVALNTYKLDPDALKFRTSKGWKQDAIWAACLGLTDEVKQLVTEKLSDGPYRFPAFWGPGYDWSPDHNWGGSGMIALQEMLVQERGGKIILFPSCPPKWNVRFKMHLSGNTIVEASLKDGKAEYSVSPKNRENDVILLTR